MTYALLTAAATDEGRDESMTILCPALVDCPRILKLSGMLEALDVRLAPTPTPHRTDWSPCRQGDPHADVRERRFTRARPR
jgi:hypothetical protein